MSETSHCIVSTSVLHRTIRRLCPVVSLIILTEVASPHYLIQQLFALSLPRFTQHYLPRHCKHLLHDIHHRSSELLQSQLRNNPAQVVLVVLIVFNIVFVRSLRTSLSQNSSQEVVSALFPPQIYAYRGATTETPHQTPPMPP